MHHYKSKIGKGRNANKQIKDDQNFYQEIWDERDHGCMECIALNPDEDSNHLGDVPNKWYFAHVLSKQAYPKFRHNKKNIIIMCPDHHTKLDHGDKTKLKCWPELEELTQELKREYYEV